MQSKVEANFINYPIAFQKSQELLLMLKSAHFPLDLFEICAELNIILSTKAEYMEYRAATHQSLPEIPIGDGRSYLTYNRNGEKIYSIIYDEKPYYRWRFTIAHELGHIILGHLNDQRLQIDRGGIDSSLYRELENQADVFASNFLCPLILIREKLSSYSFPYTESTISNTFLISSQATKFHRLPDYQLWLKYEPSEIEEELLLRFREDMHYHRCNNCYYPSNIINAQYCSVCGKSNNFNRFIGGKEVIYSAIKQDENHRPIVCPRCNNEQLPESGEFCQICGLRIYNICSDRDNTFDPSCSYTGYLDGDARYCPYCGSKTSYLLQGILKPYKEEITYNIEDNSETFE